MREGILGLLLLLAPGLVVAGLASLFTRAGKLRVVVNLVVGMVGSLAGGLLFMHFGQDLFGAHDLPVVALVVALVAAVVLLGVVGLIKR
jgi:uncharacterized membrane protein YeaQ/YmgE (transglycosylase-associated protein family)